MRSYLVNRVDNVSYKCYKSSVFTVTSGVPQRSNRGPLLFVLFTDDLLTVLNWKVLAYADDIKIFTPISSTDDDTLLQENLDIITEWCTKFLLAFNVKKSHFMSYAKRN